MSHTRGYGWLVIALFALAIAIRAIPLFSSTLPTPHGFGYIVDTMVIIDEGHLVAAGRTDHFFWHTFLVNITLVLGIEPLYLARPLSSILGALPVLLAIAITRRLCAYWDWPPKRIWTASALAGLFIGIQGLYLYRSLAPHPNILTLFLMPLFVIVLHRAHCTHRRSWWVATVLLLFIIPPMHGFAGLVTAIIVTILAGIVVVQSPTLRETLPVLAVTGFLWLYLPAFHLLLRALTPTHIAYTERVTEVPGLYIAWLIIGVIGTVYFIHQRPRTQRWIGWSLFGVFFVLLALNAITPLFHQAPRTPPVLLAGILPLFFLVILANWRLPDITTARIIGPPLVAIVAGTLVIGAITLTSLPTVAHLTTAERANYYLHLPLMILAGMGGAVFLSRITLPSKHSIRAGVAVALILCAAASIPIAFAGVPILPYENSVTGAEFTATTFAMSTSAGEWTTDKQINDIASRIQSGSGDRPSPFVPETARTPSWSPTHSWMQSPGTDPPDCPILSKDSWTTGAMFYPLPVESLGESTLQLTTETSQSIYHGGAGDNIRLLSPTTGSTSC